MSSRLPLPQNDQLPAAVVARLESLPAINVYRQLGNAPHTVIPWTDMVKALYESKVEIRLREIAILRQAAIAKSDYELHQHRFIARANGITDEEIHSITTEEVVTSLSEKENVICKMAQELEQQATVTDETFASLQRYFDHQELAELIILTSFYCCVARVLNATAVEIEETNPLSGAMSPN